MQKSRVYLLFLRSRYCPQRECLLNSLSWSVWGEQHMKAMQLQTGQTVAYGVAADVQFETFGIAARIQACFKQNWAQNSLLTDICKLIASIFPDWCDWHSVLRSEARRNVHQICAERRFKYILISTSSAPMNSRILPFHLFSQYVLDITSFWITCTVNEKSGLWLYSEKKKSSREDC